MNYKSVLLCGFAVMAIGTSVAQAKPKAVAAKAPVAAISAYDQAVILRDDTLKSNVGYEFVSELTTRFGARPAGSESERNSAIWAAEKLKEMGFQNVHIDTFPLSVWERGAESIEITAPFPQKLVGVALGQSTASPAGGVEAEAVIYDTYQLFLDSTTDVTGKIVVVLQPMAQASDGAGYGRMSGTVRRLGPVEAQKRGAVGYVMRSLSTDTHRFAHTGTGLWSDGKGIPSMAISVPDALALGRIKVMQKQGKAGPLRLKMTTGGKFLGVRTSQNVVADIVGSEYPQEVIVIGGHLDSWDQGTGAVDDGAGIAISVAAAKAMIDHGFKPKRTVRVVLWGSEEIAQPVDLAGTGGGAYATSYKANLPHHIAAGESDFGANKVVSAAFYQTDHPSFIKDVGNLLYPLGVFVNAKEVPQGGSDTEPMVAAGVAAFDLNQNGYNYFDVHHTPDDVLERIDPANLSQNVAAWAASVWMIANTDVKFKPIKPQ